MRCEHGNEISVVMIWQDGGGMGDPQIFDAAGNEITDAATPNEYYFRTTGCPTCMTIRCEEPPF